MESFFYPFPMYQANISQPNDESDYITGTCAWPARLCRWLAAVFLERNMNTSKCKIFS